MRFIKNRREGAAKLLLYLVITTFIFFHAEKMDVMTAISYLVVSAAIWAVVWFIYVFVRDVVIAVSLKKPTFQLPKHIQEDAELEELREEMFQRALNDPYDPSFHPFEK